MYQHIHTPYTMHKKKIKKWQVVSPSSPSRRHAFALHCRFRVQDASDQAMIVHVAGGIGKSRAATTKPLLEFAGSWGRRQYLRHPRDSLKSKPSPALLDPSTFVCSLVWRELWKNRIIDTKTAQKNNLECEFSSNSRKIVHLSKNIPDLNWVDQSLNQPGVMLVTNVSTYKSYVPRCQVKYTGMTWYETRSVNVSGRKYSDKFTFCC